MLRMADHGRSGVPGDQATTHCNARTKDLMHERIADGTVMIETQGAIVDQINGLTVHDMSDHVFGAPSRVTARASAGTTSSTSNAMPPWAGRSSKRPR